MAFYNQNSVGYYGWKYAWLVTVTSRKSLKYGIRPHPSLRLSAFTVCYVKLRSAFQFATQFGNASIQFWK